MTTIYNQLTGENFTSATGEFDTGVLDSFEILYLGSSNPSPAAAASNQASIDICEGFSDAGNTFTSFFVIIIIVGVAGLILLLLLGDGEEVDLGAIAFALVVVGFVLSIGASIIFKIGGC